ncbi:hypothetical protein HK098_000423, partial [Nowakowskiella sp. JEL0407]
SVGFANVLSIETRWKVDLKVSIVIGDHQPVPGIVKFFDFKNLDDNTLKISEAAL